MVNQSPGNHDRKHHHHHHHLRSVSSTSPKMSSRLGQFWPILILLAVLTLCDSSAQSCSQKRNVYIDQSGDVVVIGLFNLHKGPHCENMDARGVRLLHAAHWTVDRLNHANFLPNITLGFRAIDVCGDNEVSFQKTFKSLTIAGYPLPENCRSEKTLGYIGPPESEESNRIKTLLQVMEIPYVQSIEGGQRPAIKAIIKMLQELNCTKATAIAFQGTMLDLFRDASKSAKICLAESILLHDKASMTDLTTAVNRLNSDPTGTFVLLGNDLQIHTLLTVLKSSNAPTDGKWIVYGIETLNKTLIAEAMPFDRFIVVHPEGTFEELAIDRSFRDKVNSGGGPFYTELYLKKNKCDAPSTKECDFLAPVDSFYVLQNAILPIFALADTLHNQNLKCSLNPECKRSKTFPILQVEQKDVDLRILTSAVGPSILNKVLRTNFSYISDSMGVMTKIGSYHQEGLPLTKRKKEADDSTSCLCFGHCRTAPAKTERNTGFLLYYNYTWVIVCLTIGACGLVTDFIILLHIIVYIFKGKRTEGSQFFTLILILGNMALYACMLSYAMKPSEIVCTFKTFGSSLSLAIVFSVMFARTLLMVTTDTKGFQGHISGLLQACIFFLMVITQVMLVILIWWFKKSDLFLNGSCVKNDFLYLAINGYDSFLLCCLLLFCPFAAKNRRNYKEGLQFVVTNSLTACVWVSWIVILFTQDSGMHDATKCIAIVAIATIQLIVIFIPRACAIAMVPESKSYGIPTITGNHLSAASNPDICDSSMRMYDTINRGYVPDQDHGDGNDYMVPTISNGHYSQPQVYRKATII